MAAVEYVVATPGQIAKLPYIFDALGGVEYKVRDGEPVDPQELVAATLKPPLVNAAVNSSSTEGVP